MTISFKARVAIVTGAGGGLGREYALELARRGAKVVVNDLGGARDGTGTSDAAAQVVEEIEKAGGEAIANGASVTEYDQMEKMVADAKQKWGGVHVLINNAGITRDGLVMRMKPEAYLSLIPTFPVFSTAHKHSSSLPPRNAQDASSTFPVSSDKSVTHVKPAMLLSRVV